ncbi:MAG TPA: hypothetical protein VE914_20590 [Candidatus Angelobacter sp.]|nr:hypothetical protein [Candidatus Angelobacter sp.]
MVNRILLAAILCAGTSMSGLPTTAALAGDATTVAPTLELADQPASDEDLKKESGSAAQSVGGNTSGLMLPTSTGQAAGTAPSFDNAGTSTISTNNSLTAISTLSATVNSNGFQN